jgi:hypothetical protein
MKLTKHSRKRIKERTHIKKRGQERFFRLALNGGISLGQARQLKLDKLVIEYLKKLNRGQQVKIYNDYVFIYCKNSKRLYTMYKCPENISESIRRWKSEKNSNNTNSDSNNFDSVRNNTTNNK